MCGRFTLTWPSATDLAKLLGVAPTEAFSLLYRPRWNVAPTDPHWVVRLAPPPKADPSAALYPGSAVAVEPGHREIAAAKWGFAPPPPTTGAPSSRGRRGPLINARSESVRMPGVREAFSGESPASGGRCVVPVDGFYEWIGEAKAKRPIWFSAATGDLLRFAGVWEAAPGGEGARFTIFTTVANDVVAPVHDRMPVILAPGDVDAWLEGDANAARALLRSAPAGTLTPRAVTPRANSVKNDDPACLDPWDPTLEIDLRGAVDPAVAAFPGSANAPPDFAAKRPARARSSKSATPARGPADGPADGLLLFGESDLAPDRRPKSR